MGQKTLRGQQVLQAPIHREGISEGVQALDRPEQAVLCSTQYT